MCIVTLTTKTTCRSINNKNDNNIVSRNPRSSALSFHQPFQQMVHHPDVYKKLWKDDGQRNHHHPSNIAVALIRGSNGLTTFLHQHRLFSSSRMTSAKTRSRIAMPIYTWSSPIAVIHKSSQKSFQLKRRSSEQIYSIRTKRKNKNQL